MSLYHNVTPIRSLIYGYSMEDHCHQSVQHKSMITMLPSFILFYFCLFERLLQYAWSYILEARCNQKQGLVNLSGMVFFPISCLFFLFLAQKINTIFILFFRPSEVLTLNSILKRYFRSNSSPKCQQGTTNSCHFLEKALTI